VVLDGVQELGERDRLGTRRPDEVEQVEGDEEADDQPQRQPDAA
jgi:hypothetical protein